jgi:DNA-directed RNA polymerase specialized sigma subunit
MSAAAQPEADEERMLWIRATGDDRDARSQLIERYLPLCRVIAASLYGKTTPSSPTTCSTRRSA